MMKHQPQELKAALSTFFKQGFELGGSNIKFPFFCRDLGTDVFWGLK